VRYPSERTQKRLRQISDLIEEEVDRLGKAPPVEELQAAVMKVIPDAKQSEFKVALHRLHLITSG
jgi:hypothetical protein